MAKNKTIDAAVSRYRTQTPNLPAPLISQWDWQRSASCRAVDVAVFYPPNSSRGDDRETREARAKKICNACPVQQECRTYALAAREPYGIWGGTTAKERALLTIQS
ncbi:WhiB family transcriptional regulator [Williamsia soli]|uniref:WhiB family transcriptional regulator n=1 Tax=Williamsia soli TaxID=364929 RepID=UPI001A9CEA51|nr:WhiB family transcriptional regulator [Williamsia soli]